MDAVRLMGKLVTLRTPLLCDLDNPTNPNIGMLDAPKLRSSVDYFAKIARELGDEELYGPCERVSALMDRKRSKSRKL